MDLGMDALLALFAANNPGIGPQLDAAGIQPPMGLGGPKPGVGEMLMGGGQGAGPMAGQAPQIGPWETAVNPAPPAAGAQNPAMALAALQGMQAPKPITPIMTGGVTGGVKPPEVNAAGLKQGSPAITALMQALLQHQAGPTVPNLGALVRGAI